MIIAIPVTEKNGKESRIHGHFGSAPIFAFYNTDADTVEFVQNENDHHDHGQCTPTGLITKMAAGYVISAGMGRRAIASLNAIGVKVLVSGNAQTIEDAADMFRDGELKEMCADDACSGHH